MEIIFYKNNKKFNCADSNFNLAKICRRLKPKESDYCVGCPINKFKSKKYSWCPIHILSKESIYTYDGHFTLSWGRGK